MANTSVRRHVVQVTETPVGPAVQTIGVVGKDVCGITQQDIRKVVDFRMFTLTSGLAHCQPSSEASTILLDLFAQESPPKVKLANNPCVRQDVLKVSETPMAPAVHIPIVVGNEQYVVIQQDIRKEMDIRVFTYIRLGPVTPAAAPVNVFGCPVTTLQPLCLQALQVPHMSLERKVNDVALGRSNNQLCYSAATSTDGLMKNHGCQHCPSCQELYSSCETQTTPPSLDANLLKNVSCQTLPTTMCTGCNTSSSLHVVCKDEMDVEEEGDEVSDPCQPCTEQESFVQQRPVLRNHICSHEEPCTSRLINMEDRRRRYDRIRAKIFAQRLAELRRQQRQAYAATPQSPSPQEWLSNYEYLNRERRQRDNR